MAKVLIGAPYDVDFASFDGFDRKIFLVRDPRDWLVSSLLFGAPAIALSNADADTHVRAEAIAAVIALLRCKEADPASVSILDLIHLYRRLWSPPETVKFDRKVRPFHLLPLAGAVAEHYRWRMELLSEFLRRHPDYFIVKYEDFVSGQLRPIEDHLGFSLQGECNVDPHFKRVVRTKRSKDWRNWLLQGDVEFFRPIFSPFMEEFGYADDWTLSETPVVAPEHASIYVCNIIAEREADLLFSDPAETNKLIAKAVRAFKTFHARSAPGDLIANRCELELEIIEIQALVNLLIHQLKIAGKWSRDLTSAKARIEVLKAKLDETRSKLQQIRAEQHRVRQSLSWRIIRPFRSISSRLRRPGASSAAAPHSFAPWKPLTTALACILLAASAAFAIVRRKVEDRQNATGIQNQLTDLAVASWKYRQTFGEYPKGTSADIARALRGDNPRRIAFFNSPVEVAASTGALLDPWHRPIEIETNGKNLAITSSGPDQRFGDADDAMIKVHW